MQRIKPTTSQLVIIHTAESAGISALMTLVGGVYQYVFTNGLNIPGLLGFLGIAFTACMSMMYKSVRSNPALGQAAIDTANEAKALAAQAIPLLHQHLPEPGILSTVGAPVPAHSPFVQAPLPPQQAFPAPTLAPPSWTQQTPVVQP